MAAIDAIMALPNSFNAKAAGDMQAVYQFDISTPAYVIVDKGTCTAHKGTAAETPSVTIKMSDENLLALLAGTLSGTTAFMTGKLKVQGNMMLAQKMPSIFALKKPAT